MSGLDAGGFLYRRGINGTEHGKRAGVEPIASGRFRRESGLDHYAEDLNVSKKDYEIAFVARILAALENPVGIYFVSEDIFTLASYYRTNLRDEGFFPSEDWQILPEAEQSTFQFIQEGKTDE